MVSHYVEEYDVPEVDVAAALAAVLQGEEPMLLEPEPERPRGVDRAPGRGRDERAGQDRGGRPEGRGSRPGPSAGLTTYRIAVGRRHKIAPRQIVGALANEGGLQRGDFGKIEIRADHSLVELPASLPPGVWDALRSTRISGQLIHLELDAGRPERGEAKPRKKRG